MSSTSNAAAAAVNGVEKKQEKHQFGWAISDKIIPETTPGKIDVWSVFSPLAGYIPEGCLNLGQGFMNFGPEPWVLQAHEKALQDVMANHYSLPRGRASLRQAVSRYLSPSFNLPEGRALDANTEVQITAGANEGMFAFAAAFLRDGDEVILLEPFFDQYVPQVHFNGAKPVYVPIRPPASASTSTVSAADWKVDLDELRAAITPKTKMIFLNTPHNPIGKVFNEEELRGIGKVAEEANLLILSDEVYDCLTFGKEHVRIAALDDFWKRTVTIGSAGKSFAATGWRVGWAVGPPNLITPLMAAHTRLVFCVNSPAQEAVASGINQALDNGFFQKQIDQYDSRKKVMCEGLDKLGLPYTIPDGAYFILINTERLQIPADFEDPEIIAGRAADWRAAWFVAQTAKCVLIPVTDFYDKTHWHLGEKYIRIAFCKDEETLKAAGERLLALKPYIKEQ